MSFKESETGKSVKNIFSLPAIESKEFQDAVKEIGLFKTVVRESIHKVLDIIILPVAIIYDISNKIAEMKKKLS